MLHHHPSFLRSLDFDGSALTPVSRLDGLISLLQQSLVTVSAAARRGRLLCLRHVVQSLSTDNTSHVAVLPSILGEVMLCCRDSNAKVRTAAEAVLGAMAEWMSAAGDGPGFSDDNTCFSEGLTASLTEMFRMTVGGLGASTPHMRSASVSALALLLYNFSNRPVVMSMLPALTEAVLLLVKVRARVCCATAVSTSRSLRVSSSPNLRFYKVELHCSALLSMRFEDVSLFVILIHGCCCLFDM